MPRQCSKVTTAELMHTSRMSDIALHTPIPDRYDETRNPDGTLGSGWSAVLGRLESLSVAEREARRHEIDVQLRGNGIAYNPLSSEANTSRPWELDLVPMVLEPQAWSQLESGIRQRARLKQALLSDIYGAQSVLTAGILPPALIYAHQGYLRDACGLPGTDTLPLFSIDVSRSPSGHWYAVDDHCQYPAGLGYTLENRLVLSRVLPNLFRDSRVRRIAAYFRALQQRVVDAMDRGSRCVMLSYGASHSHYFEYAWLAKYLGYTLVEPADLTVRDENVFLKTVNGLQRVNVILRFVNDRDMDPLAVGSNKGRGIPGLFQAVRSGGVTVINPLGTGVLDNPAFNAYLPALCEHLLGESVELLGAPTYWLGDETHRHHALGKLDALLVRDISSGSRVVDPKQLSAEDRATLNERIERMPERFIAQEPIDRSIAPSIGDDVRVSRQIMIRSFMVNSGSDFEIMAGGLCLLDTDHDGSRNDFGSLAGSKDVWVLSKAPVTADSLLRSRTDELDYAMLEGELPSRVAENLFWLGRNAERVESLLRLLRAVFSALQNDDSPIDASDSPLSVTMLLRALTVATSTLPGFAGRGGARKVARPSKELLSLLHDETRAGSLAYTLVQLQRSASVARDRVSPEFLKVLNRLDDDAGRLQALPHWPDIASNPEALNRTLGCLDELIMSMSAVAGLAEDNLTHGDGWRFLTLGRRIERARQSAVILQTMIAGDREDVLLLERLLILFDSVMTYRSRYRSRIDIRLVVDLLVQDEDNPRSLAFQYLALQTILRQLPGRHRVTSRDPLLRPVVAGLSRVRLADPKTLLTGGSGKRQSVSRFLEVLARLPEELAESLTSTYFTHVEVQYRVGDGLDISVDNDSFAK